MIDLTLADSLVIEDMSDAVAPTSPDEFEINTLNNDNWIRLRILPRDDAEPKIDEISVFTTNTKTVTFSKVNPDGTIEELKREASNF